MSNAWPKYEPKPVAGMQIRFARKEDVSAGHDMYSEGRVAHVADDGQAMTVLVYFASGTHIPAAQAAPKYFKRGGIDGPWGALETDRTGGIPEIFRQYYCIAKV